MPYKSMPFNGKEVLVEAKRLLLSEDYQNDFSDTCPPGQYCPHCAVAKAKIALEKKHDVEIDPFWMVKNVGFKETPYDKPLTDARDALPDYIEGNISLDDAVEIIDKAIANNL